ncbi:MAG TPA: S8 family serine peptidase, partial [Verrucomicrobiae bacterium]|nr:S8 family serine peptidase [Verrucomicrobiae bacterium]
MRLVSKDFSRRQSVWLAALLLSAASSAFADGSSSGSVVVFDAGQPRRFEVGADELHFKGREAARWLQQLPAESSMDRVRARAAGLAATTASSVKLVLYEAGRPRNEFNRRLLSSQVLVRLAPGARPESVLDGVPGIARWRALDYLAGAVVVEALDPTGALALADALRIRPGARSAEAQLARQHHRKLVPNDTLFSSQWHLRNTGQAGGIPGLDVNVTNVWNTYRGAGVVIGIVDDGLESGHPDLTANYSAALSYDFNDDDPNPDPMVTEEAHGTACAGLAAARGNNGIGVSGVAYEARLAGFRLIAAPTTDATDASALLANNQAIHIKNSSWGPPGDGQDLYGTGSLSEAALAEGTDTGRGGRGTIYVFSAGNGLAEGDNANYSGYAQSIHVIAVGAISDQGAQTEYSTPGACVAISTPSGGIGRTTITTTDLTGFSGFNGIFSPGDISDKNYTALFNGTSASAPMASGVIALLLQANPNLGWRDVKEILMRTASMNAASDSDWSFNSAGFHFNHKFGAGLINAQAAVAAAQTWTNLSPATIQFAAANGVGLAIPDANAAGIDVAFAFTNEFLRVEHARVTVDLVHPRRGQIAITLTSPGGMKSRLTELHGDTNQNFYSWPLTSVRHWGESSAGAWTVNFADRQAGQTGQLISARLELIGAPVNPLSYTGAGLTEMAGAANGNGTLDPGETVQANFFLRNNSSTAIADLTGALTTTTPGVTLLQAGSSYAGLAAGALATNMPAFAYRVSRNVPCGTVIHFSLVSTNQTVRLTNHFLQVVGQLGQAGFGTNTFESADAPKPVPDLTTTLATNVISASGARIVDDVNVSVRLDHTTVGDLQIALVHPDGTEVLLADHAGGNNPNLGTGSCGAGEVRTVYDDEASTDVASGAAPFIGAFRPTDSLASLRGKPVNGTWKLRLSDQYSNDFGTLFCWALRVASHEQTVACSVFNPPPVATNVTVSVPMNSPASGMLTAGDIDADPL